MHQLVVLLVCVAWCHAQSSLNLVAAVFTPFNADGSIDVSLETIGQYASVLAKGGVNCAFTCGTNGESLSLTVAERQQVLEAWAKVIAARNLGLKLIAMVGAESVRDAVALAEHAASVSSTYPNLIEAVAAQPPSFFRPGSIADLVAFMTPVAAAAGNLPFKYYHIPSLSNVQLDMNAFLLAARTAIPTFSGIKFSDPDLYTFGRMLNNVVAGEQLFYGKDEMLVPALSIGATGAVGSTYNFMAAVAVRAHEAFAVGNMTGAQLEQKRIRDVVAALIPLGTIPAQKAVMAMKGLPIGGARLPLQTLSQSQSDMLQAQLQAMGFFQWSD